MIIQEVTILLLSLKGGRRKKEEEKGERKKREKKLGNAKQRYGSTNSASHGLKLRNLSLHQQQYCFPFYSGR